ncbi:MAG TPA: hypothetical protein VL400_27535 [Polyangiaceae bacterium]|nr:hypothetical protein [Polyangiaceae bacterium]
MDAQTHDFDVVYQIGADSLLAALDRLLLDALELRLSQLDLAVPLTGLASTVPIPTNTVQQGRLQITQQAVATIALPTTPGSDELTVTVTLAGVRLALDAVAVLLTFAGVGALVPTDVGTITLTLTLRLGRTQGGGRVDVTLARSATEVSTPSGLTPTILDALSNQLDATAHATAVGTAIRTAVENAIGSLFPVLARIPFGAPALCDIGVRDLVPKLLPATTGTKASLGFFLRLQQGSNPTVPATATSSLPSDPAIEGGVVLANAFLKRLVCCLFENHPDIRGLGSPTEETSDCCHWRNRDNVSLGTEIVKIEDLSICLETSPGSQSRIAFSVQASKSGSGWIAHTKVSFDVRLALDGNAIEALAGAATTSTWVDKEWWVWLLEVLGVIAGAVIGFFLGGPWGAIGGGVIALAIVGVVDLLLFGIGNLAAGAISGALNSLGASAVQLLPPALTETFGSISNLVELDFDDLAVFGRVRPPAGANILREGSDLVLYEGDRIDLDRGLIARSGDSTLGIDADLIWRRERQLDVSAVSPAAAAWRSVDGRPARLRAMVEAASRSMTPAVQAVGALDAKDLAAWAGAGAFALPDPFVPTSLSIQPLGGARSLPVSGTSFWSLGLRDLRAIVYPSARGNRIPGTSIPRSASAYPGEARVFAVRTTAGRFAKCVAWRDAEDALHLSFITYDTPVPLTLHSTRRETRGAAIPSEVAIGTTYQVSRYWRFQARLGAAWIPPSWLGSVTFRWYWDGGAISGSDTLSDGTTTYRAVADVCELTTAMGTPLRGTLQVEATTPVGVFAATAEIHEEGTVTVPFQPPLVLELPTPWRRPLPDPVDSAVFALPEMVSLPEQLRSAFARGMDIPVDRVRFR